MEIISWQHVVASACLTTFAAAMTLIFRLGYAWARSRMALSQFMRDYAKVRDLTGDAELAYVTAMLGYRAFLKLPIADQSDDEAAKSFALRLLSRDPPSLPPTG